MTFKRNDKARVKPEHLSKITDPRMLNTLHGIGIVEACERGLVHVSYPDGSLYGFNPETVELV